MNTMETLTVIPRFNSVKVWENQSGFKPKWNLGITIYDQKLVHSWPLRHGVQVTSPAVWCQQEKEYLCVLNDQEVRRWNDDDTSIDKTRKKSVKKQIYRVFCLDGYKPVALCVNGAVNFTDMIKSTCDKSVLDSKGNIVFADIIKHEYGFAVIYVVEAKNNRTLHCQWYTESSDQWKYSVFALKYQADFDSYSCHTDENFVTHLYILGSNKELYRIEVKENGIEEETVATIHELGAEGNIVCLSRTQIAMVGLCKNNQDGIGIFDTKYSAVQFFHPYPEKCTALPQIFCLNSHIVINCDDNLYAFPCEIRTSTLSEFVGKNRNIEDMDSSALRVTTWTTDNSKVSKSSVKQLEDILNNLISPSITPTKSAFSKQCKLLLDVIANEGSSSSMSSLQMIQLCQRCLSEKKFWPSEEIEQLLHHGCIPSGISSELMAALIEKKEKALLHLSLQKLSEIPESALVQTLQYLMGLSESEFENSRTINKLTVIEVTPSKCEFGPLKAHYIREVLCQPFSDMFFINHLRKLNFQHVLSLLEFLFYLMAGGDEQSVSHSTRPTLQNVVDWISCIIDAHVTQLILSPDARVLLIKLHEAVTQQTQFFDGMIELEAVLSQYKAKLSNSKSPSIGQYCIEVLHVY